MPCSGPPPLAGLSPSAYARKMLLTGKVVRVQSSKLDPETLDQLRRIGVNLNQAVHKFHTTGKAPPELES
ncbi:MAG: MobC family plasmid mobilization relaxosome protein, partial [Desulfuromonadales bacterium]|nr:MobC family plasmid mobilization relaxosome protein [Desulfuromonadales bacterium]